MSSVRVTCVIKPDHKSSHEDITHLGGSGWQATRDSVITKIDTGTNTFFVLDAQGNRADVEVVDPGYGRARYVRAYADGVWNDTLLSLPDCS